MIIDRRQSLALLGAAGAFGLGLGRAAAQTPEPGLYQIGASFPAGLGRGDAGLTPWEDGGFSVLSLHRNDELLGQELYTTRYDDQLNVVTSARKLVDGEEFRGCAQPVRGASGVTVVAAIRRTGPVHGQVVLYRVSDAGAVIGAGIDVGLVEPHDAGHCRMVSIGGGSLLIAWQSGGSGGLSNVRYRIVGVMGDMRSPIRTIKRKSGRDPHVLVSILALADGHAAIAFHREVGASRPVLIQKIDSNGAPVGDLFALGEGFAAFAALPDGGLTAVWGRQPADIYDRATMCVQFRKGGGQLGSIVETLIEINTVYGQPAELSGFQVLRAPDGRLVVAVGGDDHSRSAERRSTMLLMLLTGKGRQLQKETVLGNDGNSELDYKARSLTSLTDGTLIVVWSSEVYYRDVIDSTLHRFRLV